MSLDENTQKRFLLNRASADRFGSRRTVEPIKQAQTNKPIPSQQNPAPKPSTQPSSASKPGCNSCSRRKGK